MARVWESTMYAVPIEAHEAKGMRVADWCWGSCGHGLIGGIDLGERRGSAIPCATKAADCPHFDAETEKPWGTVEDERQTHTVYLRRLKP